MELLHTKESMEGMLKQIAHERNINSYELIYFGQIPSGIITVYDDENLTKIRKTREIAPQKLEDVESMWRGRKEVIAVSSIVTYGDHDFKAHLPQLDLDQGYLNFDENRKYIEETLDELLGPQDTRGYVIQTGGTSFHFQGKQLMSEPQWKEFMEKAHDLGGKVDKQWCELQLRRGFSALRLTSSSLKETQPKVLYEVIPTL